MNILNPSIDKVLGNNGVVALITREGSEISKIRRPGDHGERLLVSQPSNEEQAEDVTVALIKSGQVQLLITEWSVSIEALQACQDNDVILIKVDAEIPTVFCKLP